MRFTVVIETDAWGSFPMLLHDDETLLGGGLLGGDNTHWKLVAETDDYAEAVRLTQAAQERCYGREG
jgi:hypothetical protein